MMKMIEMIKPVNESMYTMKKQRLMLVLDFNNKPTAPAVRRMLNFVFTLENKRWSIFRKTQDLIVTFQMVYSVYMMST